MTILYFYFSELCLIYILLQNDDTPCPFIVTYDFNILQYQRVQNISLHNFSWAKILIYSNRDEII